MQAIACFVTFGIRRTIKNGTSRSRHYDLHGNVVDGHPGHATLSEDHY